MLLIGAKNSMAQTVATNGTVNLGSVYRKYCRKNSCGTPAFSFMGDSIALNQSGIYHVTATLVAAGSEAGVMTVGLYANGVLVPAGISSETITTATTELRTMTIDHYILVDRTCSLGSTAITPETLTLVNTGIEAIISAVTVNVDKVI